MYQYMYLNQKKTLIKTSHPWRGSSKGHPSYQVPQQYRRIDIQFSPFSSWLEWVWWLNPCLNQSDLMIPFIHVDKSCDRLTFHVCYWMLGIHKEIPTRLISMSGKYWIDPALGVLVVIHMSKWSGRVLILTSD